MSYIDEVLDMVAKKNPAEPEFLQAVKEVLESLRVVVEANEEKYRREALLERLVEPDRQIKFRVQWVDDKGQMQVNTGSKYSPGIRLDAMVRGLISLTDTPPEVMIASLIGRVPHTETGKCLNSSTSLCRCSRVTVLTFVSSGMPDRRTSTGIMA